MRLTVTEHTPETHPYTGAVTEWRRGAINLDTVAFAEPTLIGQKDAQSEVTRVTLFWGQVITVNHPFDKFCGVWIGDLVHVPDQPDAADAPVADDADKPAKRSRKASATATDAAEPEGASKPDEAPAA